MKKLSWALALLLLAAPAFAQSMGEDPGGPARKPPTAKPAATPSKVDLGIHGARYPHVSPDGKQLAFALHGDLWVVPVEGGRATRLTLNEANDIKPVWSPDGRRIAFTSDRSGSFDVYIMPADGGVPTRLTHHYATDHICDFDPDGKSVVFQSSRTGSWRLYRIPVDGGTPVPLTLAGGATASVSPTDGYIYYQDPIADTIRMGYRGSANDDIFRCKPGELPERLTKNNQTDREPHVTPDGKRVYFSRETGPTGKDYNLFVLDLETKKETQVTNLDELGLSNVSFNKEFTRAFFVWKFRVYTIDITAEKAEPKIIPISIIEDTRRSPTAERTSTRGAESADVSPDGNHIVFALGGTIWVMDSSGGNARQLTPGPDDHYPRFSPDGRMIAFYSARRSDSSDIFVMNSDGSGIRRVTTHPKGDFFQNWSPDGRYLVFCSDRSGNKDIWKVGFDGSPPVQLTRTRYNDDDPSVSADGTLIAFDSWPNGRADIFVMNADGSNVRQVYGTIAQEESPRFSPDGRLLVFTRTSASGISATREVIVTDLAGSGEVLIGQGSDGSFTPNGKEIVYVGPDGTIRAAPAPEGIEGGRTIPFIAKREMKQNELFAAAFDDAWSRVNEAFYDPKFHGVDWKKLREKYRPLAVGAETRMEFYNYMRMMIGELNASHQGISGPISDIPNFSTGDLACELIPEATGIKAGGRGPEYLRLRVKDPARGGPADQAWIRDGDYIFGVGRKRLTVGDNFYEFLKDTVGKDVPILVGTKPDGSDIRQVTVKPESINQARGREYQQWVAANTKTTVQTSRGAVAYIHIPAMNSTTLRQFQSQLGSRNVQRAKALIIDVRANGGGNIHQALIDILSRRHYANNTNHRNQKTKSPDLYWARPVVLLIDHRSFSDAEVFAHAFKALKLGPIVGVPTPGAVIGTRDVTLVDGSRFRVTLAGFINLDGTNQEGNGCVPDYLVEISVEDRLAGRDPQLAKAIEVAMEQIKAAAEATKPAPEKPAPEKPAPEKPAPEKPAPEKPAPEKPAPEKPAPEKPTPEKPTPEKPTPEKPTPEKPTPEKPTPEKPTPEKPTPEKPTPEKPTPEKPTPEKPTPEKPTPEKPTPEKPTPEKPTPEKPTPEKPVPEKPTPEKPVPEKTDA